jgi:hypothetical protein
MEISVRYIQVNEAFKPALCFRDRGKVYGLINDESCVRVLDISIKEYDRATQAFYGAFPYPVELAAERYSEVAERKGATLRAQSLLRIAKHPAGMLDLIVLADPLPPDEVPYYPPEFSVKAVSEPASKPRSEPRRAPIPADLPPIKTNPPGKSAPAKSGLIAKIAAELGIAPQQLRLSLRLAGLRAPYEDEALIRSKLK